MNRCPGYTKWIVGIMLLLAAACRHRTPADPQTALFGDYLNQQFHQQIPEQPHFFLLVPASGCKGGMANALMQIDGQRYPATVTVLTTDPQMVRDYLHQPWPVQLDASGDLDLLNLPVTNVSLIATRDRKITAILSGKECADGPGDIIALLKKG